MGFWKRFEYTQEFDWIEKISCILCTLYCVFIFVITIRLFINANLIDLSSIGIQKIAALSLVVLLSYIVSCVAVIMNHYDTVNHYIQCCILIKIAAYLYSLSKFLLYIFLTFRVDIAFDNSSLRYKKWVLNAFRMAASVAFAIISFAIYIYLDGMQIKSQIAFHLPFCQPIIPIQVAIIGVTLDTLVSCSCLCLFGRKIYQASMRCTHRASSSNTTRSKDEMLINTFRKNAVLAFVAIVSTFILIFISTFGLTGMTIPLDNCINASCLYLMFAGSQHTYTKLCGKCEHCINDSLLAKFACIWSEQHLKRLSTLRVQSVTIHHHNQRSDTINSKQTSSQTSPQTVPKTPRSKPIAIEVIDINKQYLTPVTTLSTTPNSMQTPISYTKREGTRTPITPIIHKKRVSSRTITPIQDSDLDEKSETFTHVARNVSELFEHDDVSKIIDILENEKDIDVEIDGVHSFEDIKLNDDMDKMEVLNIPIPEMSRESSYNPCSNEFIVVFCKENNDTGFYD